MVAARLPCSATGSGSLKKIRMPSPAKRSSVPSCSVTIAAHRDLIVAQHRLDFFGLGAVGERRETAQVGEDVRDFAPMRCEYRRFASGDDRFGHGRREETLELGEPRELSDLLGDALLELFVPVL